MTRLRKLYIHIESFASIVGIMLNIFLILIIQKSREKELQKYNRVLFQVVFIDLLYTFFIFLARPVGFNYIIGYFQQYK